MATSSHSHRRAEVTMNFDLHGMGFLVMAFAIILAAAWMAERWQEARRREREIKKLYARVMEWRGPHEHPLVVRKVVPRPPEDVGLTEVQYQSLIEGGYEPRHSIGHSTGAEMTPSERTEVENRRP